MFPLARTARTAVRHSEGAEIDEHRCREEDVKHEIAQRAANAAIESYLANIGGTTEDVAKGIVESLNLHTTLQPKMQEYGFMEPWEALYKCASFCNYGDKLLVECGSKHVSTLF